MTTDILKKIDMRGVFCSKIFPIYLIFYWNLWRPDIILRSFFFFLGGVGVSRICKKLNYALFYSFLIVKIIQWMVTSGRWSVEVTNQATPLMSQLVYWTPQTDASDSSTWCLEIETGDFITYPIIDVFYSITSSTAGAVYIRFLHFLLAHYISAFKPVKDKKVRLIIKI